MIYTQHRWFRSGANTLLGHLDVPETAGGSLGVLIVPPFAWEDVCSYRPLRFLGRTLAANGIPALRFDLPGMGDSSGGALDQGLLEAWIQSVNDAATELRAATGVQEVAVVGIRMGAMLAVSAAARGANIQDLVLWGPSATGRAMLREMRAFGAMERLGFQIGGFLITTETQRALESFALSALPAMGNRRILFLSRDNLPADVKLIQSLEASGATVETAIGTGYAAMMEGIPPSGINLAITEFFTKTLPHNPDAPEGGLSRLLEERPAKAVVASEGTPVSETVYRINRSSGAMFGILAEPEAKHHPTEWCILFLNPGPVRHTGPNRMWVEAARRWAAQGIVSLRMDLLGIGESDGESLLTVDELYRVEMLEQVEAAMDSLRSRLGVQRFAVIGLCSGAFLAFQGAIRIPDIRTAILLNPRAFFWDPELDRRRLTRDAVKKLGAWRDWRRLARGQVPLEHIKRALRRAFGSIREAQVGPHRQLQPEAMANAWESIERSQVRVTLAFADDEPLLEEMEEEGQMPPETSRVRCVRVANCDHTFRPLWAQKFIHELIDSELHEVLRESRVNPTDEAREKQWAASQK